MSRDVSVGLLVIDQFPVFQSDGVSKKSGLTLLAGDFTVTSWLDGVLEGLVISISEIGTSGEYKIEWTPGGPGLHVIQIFVESNGDIWEGEYISSVASSSDKLDAIKGQVDKIDLAPTTGPSAVATGSLMDRTMNKNSGKTFNQATDSLEAIRDREG